MLSLANSAASTNEDDDEVPMTKCWSNVADVGREFAFLFAVCVAMSMFTLISSGRAGEAVVGAEGGRNEWASIPIGL